MTEGWLIFLVGIALGVAAVALAPRLVARIKSAFPKSSDPILLARDHGVADFAAPPQPIENVITLLSFEDSLDHAKFAAASQESALSNLNRRLASSLPDGLVIAVNDLELTESGVRMVVSVSKDGQKLLKKGVAVISRSASGQGLPVIQGAKDGRILEMMKEAKGAQAMTRLASLTTVIIGTAHIVSGADIAKRLKAVDAKIDRLLAYRKIDQMAALEQIYTTARGKLCRGIVTREKQRELEKMRGDLRKLRTTWRREIRNEIELIKDPNQKDWVRNVFGWIEPVDKKPHQEAHQTIMEQHPLLMLIEYSLRLDQTLAVASDTVQEFEITLQDELRGLEDLQGLLKSKADLISKKYPDLTVQPTLDGMSAILDGYGKLLPMEISHLPER